MANIPLVSILRKHARLAKDHLPRGLYLEKNGINYKKYRIMGTGKKGWRFKLSTVSSDGKFTTITFKSPMGYTIAAVERHQDPKMYWVPEGMLQEKPRFVKFGAKRRRIDAAVRVYLALAKHMDKYGASYEVRP